MISAVVLTKNEEKSIKDCIESLKWCDEIIIIDDYSQDRTVEIAKKHGAKVYRHALNDNFAAQRNFGLGKAGGEWMLFVDADERVSRELTREIKYEISKIKNKEAVGFYLKRRDFMWGRELKHGEAGNVKLLRLARKDACPPTGGWKRAVHETWDIKGPLSTLKNPLMHYPHQTLREFLADIEWMSTLHAQENKKEGKSSNLLKIILVPKFKFFDSWILKRGFLDGMPGFLVAMMMSLHSFLAWSKLWLTEVKSKK